VTTEVEPVFDAADIVRCGRDLFVQRSHVTNDFGIEWLRRHLGSAYRVHRVEFADDRPVHIDATFVPLAPGKILVNPDRPLRAVPEVLRGSGWELLPAPPSTLPPSFPDHESCRWLSMNLLSLDEKRIIVEENEEPLIRALRDWGFEPIPCPFRANYRFGGSFHCATVDVRRRGPLRSYF
jgi:glycine amidinotransferase